MLYGVYQAVAMEVTALWKIDVSEKYQSLGINAEQKRFVSPSRDTMAE